MTDQSPKKNWLSFGAAGLIAVAIIIFIPRYQAMMVRKNMSEVIQKLPDEKRGEEWLKAEKEIATIGNAARITLAQIIGGVVLLLGLYFTYQNAKTAQQTLRVTEDGKITERFSKAVELLGHANLDVRIGGIYALERIARDSKYDHSTVIEILAAYVTQHARRKEEEDNSASATSDPKLPNSLAADVQVALDAIGRRKWKDSETLSRPILLLGIDLRAAILTNANLRGVYLFGSDLRMAFLNGAKFNRAKLSDVDFRGAHVFNTDFSGSLIRGVDLSTSVGLTWEQIKTAIMDEHTKLPPEIESIRQVEQKNRKLES